MKRYRVSRVFIDARRNLFRHSFPEGTAAAIGKKEMEDSLRSQYGDFNFEEKFKRYMAFEKPALSVVEEHTDLLEDICDAYVSGNLYSALTGACCLGERIFNNIIFKVMQDFRSSPWYKKVYGKNRRGGSIIDWEDGIQILEDWGIIDDETKRKYLRLKELRTESVHYQRRDQDLETMSLEAINLVNFIIGRLFGIDQHRKDILLYFKVPGELFIKRSAENDPLVRAFYIPCSFLVGPRHEVSYDSCSGKFILSDRDREITYAEFVRLRIGYKEGRTGQ